MLMVRIGDRLQTKQLFGAGTATIERVRKAFASYGCQVPPIGRNRRRILPEVDGDQELICWALVHGPARKGIDR